MSKNKKIVISLLMLLALASLFLISGCPAPQRRPAPPPPNAVPGPAPGTRDIRDVNPTPRGPRNLAPAPGVPNNTTAEARRLATIIDKMPEVNSAYVILTGRMAIVGLDVKANLTDDRLNAVKAEVIRKIKRANNRITNVTVTADADTVTRIRGVVNGLRQGRPLSSFANEMAEITRRLAPTNR